MSVVYRLWFINLGKQPAIKLSESGGASQEAREGGREWASFCHQPGATERCERSASSNHAYNNASET